MIIIFNKNRYTVSIIKQTDAYYWCLKPYNNFKFLTKSKLKGNLDMILLAIKENEEFYNK